jgi:hypothetical protein
VPCSVGNTETTLHGVSAPPDEETWKLASYGAVRWVLDHGSYSSLLLAWKQMIALAAFVFWA